MHFSTSVRTRILYTGAMVLLAATALSAYCHAGTDPSAPPTRDTSPEAWHTPAAAEVESAIRSWLVDSAESQQAAADHEKAAGPALAPLTSGGDRLDAMIEAVSIGSDAVAQIASHCESNPMDVEGLEWLDSADVPYWMRNNIRLYVARALIRCQRYEQGLELIDGIQPADVFDPATLLFYRAVAQHQLVRVEDARGTLDQLLATDELLPERYGQLAKLMRADLAEVEDDSLDHIARRMYDVHRRLDLRQADERAQEVERGILASLDKIIDQLEQQQRQQQQQQQSSGAPSGEPMEESRLAEMQGEGKVDIKDIGDQVGWGDLPPRERERVLQQIGREFPGHYRDLMEEYLKRLATDEREQQQP